MGRCSLAWLECTVTFSCGHGLGVSIAAQLRKNKGATRQPPRTALLSPSVKHAHPSLPCGTSARSHPSAIQRPCVLQRPRVDRGQAPQSTHRPATTAISALHHGKAFDTTDMTSVTAFLHPPADGMAWGLACSATVSSAVPRFDDPSHAARGETSVGDLLPECQF